MLNILALTFNDESMSAVYRREQNVKHSQHTRQACFMSDQTNDLLTTREHQVSD